MSRPSPAVVVVLAAGEGTRMRSTTPKVLHPLAGRSLLSHVVAATRDLAATTTAVVVGAGRDQVTASLPADVVPVVQAERRGTGHAVRTALAALDPRKPDDLVVVVPGDAPLLRAETLTALVDRHVRAGAVATLLTAVVDEPFGYGRIVREPAGPGAPAADAPVRAVVEERDADEATRAIHEVCTSVYVFNAGALEDALSRLTTDNAQGEEYLTDVVGLFAADREPVAAHVAADPTEIVGVNDRVQLATAGRLLNDRLVRDAMLGGATVTDPATTWLDAGVIVGADVTLLPGTRLCGATTVGDGARIGPDTTLTDTVVGADAVVRTSTCDTAEIGAGAQVGPYAHLRPGSRLGPGAKVGAFAETKNADLGEGTKVPHLAYVGDATVGRFSNVGCGTIFVNYDGVTKNRTVVGDHVKLGSASLLIAPVHVGDGAYTGGGALVRQDVPPGALAIREGRQRTIDGWVARRRPGTPAADAAARAHADRDAGGRSESGRSEENQ